MSKQTLVAEEMVTINEFTPGWGFCFERLKQKLAILMESGRCMLLDNFRVAFARLGGDARTEDQAGVSNAATKKVRSTKAYFFEQS